MPLSLYNSLSKKKEIFTSRVPREVSMYVCGPTVYDEPHIGHLRSAYVFDVMRRYLEYTGYQVNFIRNVTDVDDKIIEKARLNNPEGLLAEVKSVSQKYLLAYQEDLKKLGIVPPTKEPKATEHIQDMIWLIERLLKNSQAYESQGDVYFDVASYKNYGKLSHQKKEEMLESARLDPNEKKKNPLDFALWKRSKEGEPFWESPWGKGRPGWHIECSAMSMKYLGQTFDIHGGGLDLKFPHHENEIAQSESVTGANLANYWVHHGLVTVNEQKMSKSLKNFVTLTQIASEGPNKINELKLLFLGTHYTKPLDFSSEAMVMQQSIDHRFRHFLEELEDDSKNASKKINDEDPLAIKQDFSAAMEDDFNTPQALTVLHQKMTQYRSSKKKFADSALIIKDTFENMLSVLGLAFKNNSKDLSSDKYIQSVIQARTEAKDKKNFKLADEIRDQLLKEKGILLVDKPDGTTEARKKL